MIPSGKHFQFPLHLKNRSYLTQIWYKFGTIIRIISLTYNQNNVIFAPKIISAKTIREFGFRNEKGQ